MSDNTMRDDFEKEYPVPDGASLGGSHYIAPFPANLLSDYNVRWEVWKRAWQAAQSAAVPEHIRSIKIPTDAMEQEFQKHYRRGYEAGKGDAVPVVGEAEALICDDCGAETNDPWHSSKGTNRHYHRCDSCNSIATAELAKIRAYIADGIESEGVTEHDHSIEARKLVKLIDAAIAAEKKDKENA